MTKPRTIATLFVDHRGATIIEFAIVAPVLIILLFGLLDLGYDVYVKAQLEGAMEQAGRNSTLETNAKSGAAIDAFVESRVRNVVSRATFVPKRMAYAAFKDVQKEESYSDNKPANGRYDLGECFEDVNGNQRWDADLGRTGQGGANDVVLYSMTVKYDRLMPSSVLLGLSQRVQVTASTVLRNQPYDDQVIPTVVKCK
ncbi:TadE family protein [Sphingomonas arantia]|uniref:TadE family protein n=1 Tax=Sphingomonas arantia TaxID=1460676 RepID=A0ABW4U076_9SPHN